MTADTVGRATVAAIGLVNVLLLLPVALIQLVELARRMRTHDRLQWHRLATATFVLGMVEFLSWRLLIWWDVTFWGMGLLGPTPERWRLDLLVGATILALTTPLVYVFWRDRSPWRGPRIDTATLIMLAMRGER